MAKRMVDCNKLLEVQVSNINSLAYNNSKYITKHANAKVAIGERYKLYFKDALAKETMFVGTFEAVKNYENKTILKRLV